MNDNEHIFLQFLMYLFYSELWKKKWKATTRLLIYSFNKRKRYDGIQWKCRYQCFSFHSNCVKRFLSKMVWKKHNVFTILIATFHEISKYIEKWLIFALISEVNKPQQSRTHATYANCMFVSDDLFINDSIWIFVIHQAFRKFVPIKMWSSQITSDQIFILLIVW